MTGIPPTRSFPHRWINHRSSEPSFTCGGPHVPPSPSLACVEAVSTGRGARGQGRPAESFSLCGPLPSALCGNAFPFPELGDSAVIVACSVSQGSWSTRASREPGGRPGAFAARNPGAANPHPASDTRLVTPHSSVPAQLEVRGSLNVAALVRLP